MNSFMEDLEISCNLEMNRLLQELYVTGQVATWDHNDLKESPVVQAARVLQGMEVFFPISTRLIFGIKRKEIVSNYIEMLDYASNSVALGNEDSRALRGQLVAKIIGGGARNGLWAHPYEHHGSSFGSPRQLFESCQHHNARAIGALIKEGCDFDAVAAKIQTMIDAHFNGTYFNYYESSSDNTLNIQAETIDTLFAFIKKYKEKISVSEQNKLQSIVDSLAKFILEETDGLTGLWRYSGSNSEEPLSRTVDLHHNAMIIRSLFKANVIDQIRLEELLDLLILNFEISPGKFRHKVGSKKETRLDGYIELIKTLKLSASKRANLTLIMIHLRQNWTF